MRRGVKPAKAKVEAKIPAALKSPQDENARVADLEKRLAEALKREAEALKRETEAQEQQAATAEILRVISSSPTELQRGLDAVAESATRLCAAYDAVILRRDGDVLQVLAHHGPIASPRRPVAVTRATVSGRAVLDRQPTHVADVQTETREFPEGVRLAQEGSFHTILSVPLLREGVAIGTINLRRTEVQPFTESQIRLLQTFADQAVIAIENVRLFTELQEKNRALTDAHAQVTEALEQQTATSEILRVISSSPTDVQPVFDAVVESAVRLCHGNFGAVYRYDGELIHLVAHHNITGKALEYLRQPRPPGRVIVERRIVQIADFENDPDVSEEVRIGARLRGSRSNVSVPLMRGDDCLGYIVVGKREPGHFPEKQVELLKTFADQAVIAIENVRLFTELQTSNRDLTTALDAQTATSDILRVISRSQTDVQPVFDAIVVSAVRLLGAYTGTLTRLAGDQIKLAALTSIDEAGDAAQRALFPQSLHSDGTHAQAIRDRAPLNTADAFTEPRLSETARTFARVRGYRSLVVMPLLRHDEAIGAIGVTRREPGGFSDDEIALLKTFADQAVIAIENVRLFKELDTRNRDLTESLDRQTATADILRVISQAQTDVHPVFVAIADSAMRLLRAWSASVWRYEDDLIRLVAARGGLPGNGEAFMAQRQAPRHPIDDSPASQTVLTRTVFHSADVETDPTWGPRFRAEARMRGFRSIVAVPMLRGDDAAGVIAVTRTEVGGFAPAEIALLQTFADQAVIAVENARLLTELQARTADLTRSVGQLTALGEVGQAVSSSLDLETVLTSIVSRAVQLSQSDGGVIFEYDEATEEFAQRAAIEQVGALANARRTIPIRKGEGVVGRTAVTLQPAQVPDITVAGAYEGRLRETLIASGVRAVLAVPMLREARLIGCLAVTRNAPGDFPHETVELLRTFATQSSLAIQNARLFREIADKSRQLEVASQHKSEFLANMSHELRTPLNAIIGFSEVLAEGMFGEVNEKQTEYLRDILESGQHLLSLINDILDLSKIEAGRMELELSDFDLPQAIVNALTLVRDRAARRSITLHHAVDKRLGQVRGDERKVKQVLLNLLSNALKFTPEGGRVDVRAGTADGLAEISVTDTGVGIAPEDQEVVFEEFRQVGTAAKKVEGTGLGLALSRKFIELHGGRIWVKSQVGAGSTFTFTLPVRRGE
jgi:GAF domain-containing protein